MKLIPTVVTLSDSRFACKEHFDAWIDYARTALTARYELLVVKGVEFDLTRRPVHVDDGIDGGTGDECRAIHADLDGLWRMFVAARDGERAP